MQSVYRFDDARVSKILAALQNNPGMQIESWFDLTSFLRFWPRLLNDPGDAILTAYAAERKYIILTFDRDLQKRLKKLSLPCEPL